MKNLPLHYVRMAILRALGSLGIESELALVFKRIREGTVGIILILETTLTVAKFLRFTVGEYCPAL